MKKSSLFLLFFIFSFSFLARGQEAFEIVEVPNSVNEQTYHDALKDANLDRYRYPNDRRKLYFKSGVVVEVLSAQEMNQMGIAFDSSKVMDDMVRKEDQPEFRLNESGYIMEVHQSIPQKK